MNRRALLGRLASTAAVVPFVKLPYREQLDATPDPVAEIPNGMVDCTIVVKTRNVHGERAEYEFTGGQASITVTRGVQPKAGGKGWEYEAGPSSWTLTAAGRETPIVKTWLIDPQDSMPPRA